MDERMKKYTFTSKNGMCPKCDAFGKRYYIQDRIFCGNYEYALMSRPLKMGEILRFPDRRKLAGWLNGSAESVSNDVGANRIIWRQTRKGYHDRSLIEKEGRKFILREGENEILLSEYTEPTQETGWFQSYRECLDTAKKILCGMESKINGEQMTLF